MSSGCPPEFALERYHLGEIAGTASEVWVSHIESCPRCQATLASLRAADADVVLPELRVVPLRRPVWPAVAAAFVASAASLVVFVSKPPGPGVSMKGAGVLGVSLVRGETISEYSGAEPLRAGDALQLSWTSAEAGHLVVYAFEPNGEVSELFPMSSMPASSKQLLGGRILISSSHDGAEICALFDRKEFPGDSDECRNNGRRVAAKIQLDVEKAP